MYMHKCVYSELKPHQLIPYFLMASWLYYHKGETLMSDGDYDQLCSRLADEWALISHPHKSLIDRNCLVAGTAYYIKEQDYPLIVKSTALSLLGKKT
jgi:hypothetical protein